MAPPMITIRDISYRPSHIHNYLCRQAKCRRKWWIRTLSGSGAGSGMRSACPELPGRHSDRPTTLYITNSDVLLKIPQYRSHTAAILNRHTELRAVAIAARRCHVAHFHSAHIYFEQASSPRARLSSSLPATRAPMTSPPEVDKHRRSHRQNIHDSNIARRETPWNSITIHKQQSAARFNCIRFGAI